MNLWRKQGLYRRPARTEWLIDRGWPTPGAAWGLNWRGNAACRHAGRGLRWPRCFPHGGARDGEEQREQVDDARGDDAAQPALVEVVVHPREEGVQVRDGLPLLLGPVLQKRAHLHLHGAHEPLRVALTCGLHILTMTSRNWLELVLGAAAAAEIRPPKLKLAQSSGRRTFMFTGLGLAPSRVRRLTRRGGPPKWRRVRQKNGV